MRRATTFLLTLLLSLAALGGGERRVAGGERLARRGSDATGVLTQALPAHAAALRGIATHEAPPRRVDPPASVGLSSPDGSATGRRTASSGVRASRVRAVTRDARAFPYDATAPPARLA
jgi:hypothetical protein